MNERGQVLHNMSAPAKSVMEYAGLAGIGGAAQAPPSKPAATFGEPVAFLLDRAFKATTPLQILKALQVTPGANPQRELEALLNARAAELPLPDGCVVIDSRNDHPSIWRDPLTVLAVLTKCSVSVWLRRKQPAIGRLRSHRSATLLVPPAFVDRLPERPS
jgi:hypothetical protein